VNLALSIVCVQCPFLDLILSWYVAQVLSECFEMVPFTHIITGISFAFIIVVVVVVVDLIMLISYAEMVDWTRGQ
jgi:membrane protein insertase Oxa1/YidC/SpoIIIJ